MAKVRYNGVDYMYQYNLQGDVIGLLNSSGTQVVRYRYDAWGKMLSCTGTQAGGVGTANPFRYRGYVYDTETGLYYLRSRYYNPEWGRFVNADTVMGQKGSILSVNQFAYCINSPIIIHDQNGRFWKKITDVLKDVGSLFKEAFRSKAELDFMRDKANILATKNLASKTAEIVTSMKDLPITQELFDHFLLGNGKKYTNGRLNAALVGSTAFKNVILDKFSESGQSSFEGTYNFRTGDLHYALGRVKYTASVTVSDSAIYADVIVTDAYDFDAFRFRENGLLSDTVNNLGFIGQEVGLGTKYDIEVSIRIDLH